MNVEKQRKIGETGKVQGGLYKNDQIDSSIVVPLAHVKT